MSVQNQKLLKSNALSRIGAREFSLDLGSLNNINNPVRTHKKVNLRRGKNFTSTKSCDVSSRTDMRQKSTCDVNERKFDRKKLRNAKELENCRTVRSHSAHSVKDSKTGKCPTTVRPRSVSPTPSTPPVNVEVPMSKFYSYSAKIVDQFEVIKIFINRQSDTAESLQEQNRQRKRAAEFAVRFSRNNIYQLKRVVNDIKQIIVPYPFDNLAKSDSEILCKKILLAYQNATQTLQTYINYMKSGRSLDVPEKIRELVLLIVDLHLCCEHLSIPGDQIDLLTSCKQLIVLLDAKIKETDAKAPTMRPSEKAKEAEKEEKRFSMYKTKLINTGWKKKTEALAKVKFGVPKLSSIKKLKKLEDSSVVPRATLEIYSQKRQNTPCKTKSSKIAIDDTAKGTKTSIDRKTPTYKKSRYTPREVSSQDDDIETMVQSIEDEDIVVSSTGFPERSEPITGDPYEGRSNYLNKNNIRKLVMQTIQEIQNSEKCDVKNSLKKLLKSLNHQTNIVQPRNVKLIHMVSNEPIPEEPEEEICQNLEDGEKINKLEVISENQRQMSKESKWKTIFKPISESDNNSKGKLITVSPETVNIITKYKKMLCEYRRNNVMYKRGIKVKPCELVLRISDQIINDTLYEISSGMENEKLLNQLYCNELLEVT